MSDRDQRSFHTFCRNRMIGEETEKDFIEFFKKHIRRHFNVSDEFVANSLVDRMPVTHIQDYWHLYIKELKNKLEKV